MSLYYQDDMRNGILYWIVYDALRGPIALFPYGKDGETDAKLFIAAKDGRLIER